MTNTITLKTRTLWSLLVFLLLLTSAKKSYAEPYSLEIPSQSLSSALNSFARQTNHQVSVRAELLIGQTNPSVSGTYTLESALNQLLANTLLSYSITPNGTILIQSTESQPASSETQLTPVFVVEKTSPSQKMYETPNGSTAIGRTEIDRTGPRHASEILQATPGVATVTNEQNPAVAVQIRGLKDFGRVNMNIDGMRQNFQRSGHQQRNGEMFFDTEFLSSVEISKGPSSGMGGAGATGGVATFRTIEADDIIDQDEHIGGRLRANTGVGGWANGQELSGSLTLAARPTKNTDVLLAYSQKNSGEYEPGQEGSAISGPNKGLQSPASIVNGTGQDMQSILFKTGWDMTEYQRLKFTFINTEAKYSESAQQNTEQTYAEYFCNQNGHASMPEYQEYCSQEYDPNNVYPISSRSIVENQNYALDYQYLGDSPYLNLEAKSYFVTTKNDYESLSQDVHSKTQTDTIGGFVKNNAYFELGEKTDLDWQIGLEAFKDKTEPQTGSTTLTGDQIESANGVTPEGNRTITSAFTSATLHYSDWLEITPGLRYDQYHLWGVTNYQASTETYNSVDVDHSRNKWLPTLGIAITPWQPLQLFANAGLGWRPPAITETLISGSAPGHSTAVNTYPNWTLKAEETQSWEVGFNLTFDRIFTTRDSFKLKLVHFHTDTENYIFLSNNIGIPGSKAPSLFNSMFANSLDTVTFKGEELNLDYDAEIWYGRLQVTRIERIGNLRTYYYPAGGSPNDGYYLNNYLTESSLYNPLPPEYTGSLNLGARLFAKALDLGMQLRYTDKSGSPTGQDYETYEYIDSSWVLDLYGNWQIARNLSAGFNLKNVADRQYIMASGDAVVKTYAPGRTLTAHMQWNF